LTRAWPPRPVTARTLRPRSPTVRAPMVLLRQVDPLCSGLEPEGDRVNHLPVVTPPAPRFGVQGGSNDAKGRWLGALDDQRKSQAVDPRGRSKMQHALLAAVSAETLNDS
jgi:hypothetical protein